MDNEMNLLMGIGPEVQFSPEISKTLRVGTVKQIREVGELYRDGLVHIKGVIHNKDAEIAEEQTAKWVVIMNHITIEGFTREEFDDSIPEQMEAAVGRFLFG